MLDDNVNERLKISNLEFTSRLIVGTGRYQSDDIRQKALEASGAEIITLRLAHRKELNLIKELQSCDKNVDFRDEHNIEYLGDLTMEYLSSSKYHITILPNTAGCYNAKQAIDIALYSCEVLDTKLVKLEVTGDKKTLFPDTHELLVAAEFLAKKDLYVLPYTTDDLVIAKKLQDVGCAAIMPLAAPIGSGMGIRNPYNLQILLENIKIPILVDAGVGTASDAAIAMELGCQGILINTAIAQAQNPVDMARAMKLAVEAGRLAYTSGRIPRKLYATASTSLSLK